MLHAIIDLGTNTFNLLIIEVRSTDCYEILFSDKISVKLGQDCIDKNIISEPAINRAISALTLHLETIHQYHVKNINAIATSAIRSSVNGKLFVQRIKNELGLGIEIISGDREAELIYLGVRQALDIGDSKSLIMDIGGGSTEFIIADKNKIYWEHSFNLGIARLLERSQPKDPISYIEIELIENYLKHELVSLFNKANEFFPDTLIGSSGSFDTLADVILYKTTSQCLPKDATTYIFNIFQFKELYQLLLKSDYEQRLKMNGMLAMRADMIVLGSIFINLIIDKLHIKNMKLSTFALKEGLAWEKKNLYYPNR
jgi:exopolyphosphatase/guanosine-5'-triphosphate,3'-diphosphate pyrophosphatase